MNHLRAAATFVAIIIACGSARADESTSGVIPPAATEPQSSAPTPTPEPSLERAVDDQMRTTESPTHVEQTRPTPPVSAEGTVVGHRDNDAIVDLGEGHGLRLGARVEIFRRYQVDLGEGEIAFEREPLAVGEVTALTARRALVRLGVNEQVPVGAAVSLMSVAPLTASAMHPPRVGGIWEFGGTARVFAVNSALGGGLLADAFVGYRGERPFFVRVRFDPSGFTVHRENRSEAFQSARSAGAMVMAGVDHRYFGFGAGFGVTRAIRSRATYCSYNEGTFVRTCIDVADAAHAGFSFGLHARLGTYDGLSISVDTSFTTVRQKSELSLLDLRVLIPATQQLAFSLRGGSGFHVGGASWVDIGARMRAHGDGGPGSLYITPFLGWSRLTETTVASYEARGGDPAGQEDLSAAGVRAGASAGVFVEYRR